MSQRVNQREGEPSWLEIDYQRGSEQHKQQLGQLAKVMVQTGGAQGRELDFIIDKYPQLIPDWAQANPDVASIMEEFRGSNRWLSYALARSHHLTYDNVYRALRRSPIRPYIGDFTIEPQSRSFGPEDQVVRVRIAEPGGIDLTDIRRSYYIERDFEEFSLDGNNYLINLQNRIKQETNPKQQLVLEQVYGFYQAVRNTTFPALRSQLLDQQGQPRKDKIGNYVLFPSDHQKAAIVKAAQENSLAVFDGTGSGKTGIGIGLAEYVGAKRVLVVCPAGVKDTWENKIREYYIEDPGVKRIEVANGNGVVNGEKFNITSYEALVDRATKGKTEVETLSSAARKLLEVDFDLLIVDEGHYINNSNKRSDAVLELARRTSRRLILTATPIRNSADDIARIAHLLAPDEFATPDALRALGPSGIASLTELLATQTIRRRTEDLLDLPPFCPETNGQIEYVQVELNPTQRAIYDTIFDDPALDSLSKIKLLRLAAIDHNLIRSKYKVPFEEGQAIRDLQKAYKTWSGQRDAGESVPFDSNYLVTHGYKHLFIGAHLYYKKGFDQLIKISRDEIRSEWSEVAESTKFQRIRDLVAERLAKGEKIDIFSGHFTKGIIREVIDDVTGEAIMQDLYSYLKKEFPEVEIGRIDGQVSSTGSKKKVSAREQVRQRWQTDPKFRIILTSIPSTSLGIDLTVNDRVTTGICEIGIDLPYTPTELWQKIAREYRFGQTTPVHVKVIDGLRTIDQGVQVLINKKAEIAQELLDGVSLEEIERQIINGNKDRAILIDYVTSPRKELEKNMRQMRGRGVSVNGAYLETVLQNGKTMGETIAELYSRFWEYTYSGHTARLLQQILDGLRTGTASKFQTIVDAGSGPLVLERVIKQESELEDQLQIISVDINSHMLESGVTEMQRLGYPVDRNNVIHGQMSDMNIQSGSADAVICSLAFHYSNSTEDRGRILREANRVLRKDGYYFITLPDNYLTPEQYKNFVTALNKFGFTLDRTISGKVNALDHKDVPFSVWLIAAKKTGIPRGEDLPMEEFHFNFEGPKISKVKPGGDEGNNGRRNGEDRLVKHEEFTILDPDNNFKPKGSLSEVLIRLELGLDEEMLKRYGWSVEMRQKGGNTKITIKR